ncbi:MAG: hypothetical protein P8I76_07695 [Woeseiaceae bacterium]|jgi:quercetin dioxygenase-like cupin family protein|nr:hypothetical protein [Woeseiaceae bacterium]|tara:strand:- start:335 stop:697 length:363 start_codon:yes stop_codon:yes gene_type:complete
MKNLEVIIKRFDTPDEVTHFKKGIFETIRMNHMVIGRATYEPGWKWSTHIGAELNKSYCDVEHLGMVISGKATAVAPDGSVTNLTPGDIFYIPADPHDSWVVGNEPYVSIHFLGADKYTK